jgi:hypothetical protein
MYIFEQLFSAHGYEYFVAVMAMIVFILFYYILSTER